MVYWPVSTVRRRQGEKGASDVYPVLSAISAVIYFLGYPPLGGFLARSSRGLHPARRDATSHAAATCAPFHRLVQLIPTSNGAALSENGDSHTERTNSTVSRRLNGLTVGRLCS